MKLIWVSFAFFLCMTVGPVSAQLLHDQRELVFTRADTLRGMLTPLRTCYDVTYYHLNIKVDTLTKAISGSNKIRFRVVSDFDQMQIDLFENMHIEKIETEPGQSLPFERELSAVYVRFPEKLTANSIHEITVFYSGTPQIARRPPWEGGFVWSRDKLGNPWVAVTCQGTGASLWWPNKEHQSDEPDSMLISVSVPQGLMNVSNGRLRRQQDTDGWTRWDWFVSYPINNYNVTLNIGKFAHFDDIYINGHTLTLDYYVMPYNLKKARAQFRQVKPMLACFEKYFGKYPFIRDGYKLVESPHLGMEHQTAVAYGNQYQNGYLGRASSEIGLSFDFIIIHETAHEWWGNSVTSKDIADMWIHESFGAYAEALYVECINGYQVALTYQNAKKPGVGNRRPVQGVFHVNKEGSRDMYPKGSLMLNTLRSVLDDDRLWFEVIRGIAEQFKYQTITADDLVNYVNEKTGRDFTYFFDQYLKYPKLPQLEITVIKKGDSLLAKYRWRADVKDFHMPIKITTSKHKYEFIYPTSEWQTTVLENMTPADFKLAEELFYIDVKVNYLYRLDKEKSE
ncbi:MAG: M1 family metallopeptidase [bacterium]